MDTREIDSSHSEGESSSNGTNTPDNADIKIPNQVLEAPFTDSLDALQSQDYRQVLAIIDSLRSRGLGSILQLPQLVVCGDQSSGKSSVLEAITEVPFPRKENLCTRFATEIIMRRSRNESITTKIIPDQERPDAEKVVLHAFKETITDFSELPKLMETAAKAMGLDDKTVSARGTKAFTRDVLSIEITGPDRPELTLVDLPGLIQTASKEQTQEDVTLIHELVNDYISEGRTIMLAVVSAKNDYANQGIIDKCRRADPKGERTLGIVTKPDLLRRESKNEAAWIELVQNKNIYFTLGWHVLKNRSDEEMDFSFVDRNNDEQAFFAKGAYRELASDTKGITTLRGRLSGLLYKHLKKELPKLQKELSEKLDATIMSLDSLGEKRSTYSEQKRFLIGTSMAYQAIVDSAVAGHYEHTFFGTVNTEEGFEDPSNLRRLRAAVHHLNHQFAAQLRKYGHKYLIWATDETSGTNSKRDPKEPPLSAEYASAQSLQQTWTRDQAVRWVKELLVRSRGCELPGNFNPLLMSQLFWEQSENWLHLGEEHVSRIDTLCRSFVNAAIDEVVDRDVSHKLQSLRLDAALQDRYKRAREELASLIEDKQRQPITYDPSYMANVKEARERKANARMRAMMDQAKISVKDEHGHEQSMLNPDILKNALRENQDPDMEKAIAEDALDSQLAYYKDEVTTFIANVTKQVVERHLLHGLAAHTLSPAIVTEMEEGEVALVAAEPETTTKQREHLEGQKNILESGQEAFRKALGAFR